MKKLALIVSVILATSLAHAQLGGMFAGANLKGVRTYAGIGFANYNIDSPSTVNMDNGIYAYLGGERFINDAGTSVTITLTYMNGDGDALYDYTSSAASRYTGNDVKFSSNTYQLGLGLKQRFFPSSWFRPYVEGGGLFGYHQFKYDGNLANITGPDTAYKKSENVTGMGYYGEGGVEIDFSDAYGIRVGARYQNTQTESMQTLADQKIKFNSMIFQFALLLRF